MIVIIEGSAEWLDDEPVFRPLRDFPGYLVSRCGRVLSIGKHGGKHVSHQKRRVRELKQREHPRTGHARVDVRDHFGRKMTVKVHRLIALAWHGPPPFEGAEVLHNDGTTDNHAENLRWGTTAENAQDREDHRRERAAAEFAAANPDIPF